MRILIIEDEQLAQDELVRLIKRNFPQFCISGLLYSVEESIEWLSNNSVDLIFMDIHLSDGVCFDIFESVAVTTPIIFTTAYDQYAIKAFEVNGIGYILKPLDEKKFVLTVERFQRNVQPLTNNVLELMEQLRRPSKQYKSRISVKLGDKIGYIMMSDVAYFYSEDRVTFVMQYSGKRQIVDYNIETLETMLDPMNFFRVTRGCIASISSIDKVLKYSNSRLKISLKPEYDKEILISRVNVIKFVSWLDGE